MFRLEFLQFLFSRTEFALKREIFCLHLDQLRMKFAIFRFECSNFLLKLQLRHIRSQFALLGEPIPNVKLTSGASTEQEAKR